MAIKIEKFRDDGNLLCCGRFEDGKRKKKNNLKFNLLDEELEERKIYLTEHFHLFNCLKLSKIFSLNSFEFRSMHKTNSPSCRST